MDVVIQPDRLAAANAAQIAPLKELTPAPNLFHVQQVPLIRQVVNRTNVQAGADCDLVSRKQSSFANDIDGQIREFQ